MRFKKLILIVLVWSLANSQLSKKAFAREFLSGAIVDQKGNATKISRIRADGIVKGKYKGKTLEIEFRILKKIEYLGNNVLRVTNLEGKEFNLEESLIYTSQYEHWVGGPFEYYFFDEISKEEKSVKYNGRQIREEILHTLTFGEDIGRLKFNAQTQKYYPPDYIFDPFTGEKLIWKNPEY